MVLTKGAWWFSAKGCAAVNANGELHMQNNRIILGDCCKVLPTLPAASADFILTDPPYLVGYKDREGRSIKNDIEADWLVPAFREAFRVLKPDSLCVSFYGWSKTDLFYAAWKAAGFRIVGHITFPKRYASTTRLMRYSHENAYLLAKGNPRTPAHPIGDVIDWSYSGNKLHPTQKPLSVLTPLIEAFCPRGGVVLDPFAGSGSTLIAARSVGRQYLGIELDPQFHEVASKRIAGYTERLGQYVDFERQSANAPALEDAA
jgi:site-specific DNA-methyltransferase (adenine-specific)